MLNGLGFELPLLTSFPDTSNGSGKEVFFIARKVKLCESPSKAGGLPILISLNKTQWSKIQPHLSGRAATGRPPADDKRTLEAILFVLTTGCRWRDLPSEYGSYVTAWRRHRRWTQDGTFARIWHMLLFELEFKGKLDLKKCALDGSFVRAKRGANESAEPVEVQPASAMPS